MIQNLIAFTEQPNTPETDAQDKVGHIVQGTRDGIKVQMTVMATDPLDAINMSLMYPNNAWKEIR